MGRQPGSKDLAIPRAHHVPALGSLAYGRYVIFYRAVADEVEIVRVLHGARDIRRALRNKRLLRLGSTRSGRTPFSSSNEFSTKAVAKADPIGSRLTPRLAAPTARTKHDWSTRKGGIRESCYAEPAPEDEADGGFPPSAAARYTAAPNRRILGARMRRLATLLTLILVVAACRASAAEHKLFAWRVAGDAANDPGTVYLLGSIHIGKPDLYPLPQPIEQAFAGSAELVEEIDMSGANLALLQQQVLQRGLYTGGDKLENHLSPTTRAALAAYLQRTGQAPTALSAMRPWLADMQIHAAQLQALGYAPQYAIDRHFLDEAAAAKKPVAGLETIGFQVDLLSGLPDDLQDELVFSELLRRGRPATTDRAEISRSAASGKCRVGW